MRIEADFVEIDLLLTGQEESVRLGLRSSATIGSRNLDEEEYRIYPITGEPFLVTRAEFGALLLGRFSPRLSREHRVILNRLVQDLDEGQLGSGFQHLPLQKRGQVIGSGRLVLQCLIDREGLIIGQPPSVGWHIIPDTMVDYFESEARKTGGILIDG